MTNVQKIGRKTGIINIRKEEAVTIWQM